jgi:hypothetical protein
MASSGAQTVEKYLSGLDPARRTAIAAVRNVVLDNLPSGYEETMQYGMISYVVPLARYPRTYNGQALAVASLASQKNYMSLYLMGVYGDPQTNVWFTRRYRESGKKLNMGKSCVRFKELDDLPLGLIGEVIARTPVDQFIKSYEAPRAGMKSAKR